MDALSRGLLGLAEEHQAHSTHELPLSGLLLCIRLQDAPDSMDTVSRGLAVLRSTKQEGLKVW